MTSSSQELGEPPIAAINHQFHNILRYLASHRAVVVSAAPGSGKSTLLPNLLAEAGCGPIICVQPRHVAVTTAMSRAGDSGNIAERCIAFTTTQQFLNQYRIQPVLAMYRTIVVDEAHDRTLHTDVLLGLVKASMAMGKCRCKVVVCTAGGSADEKLSQFFGGAPVVACQRAMHPVEVLHARGPVLDPLSSAVAEMEIIHAIRPPGDVLVFLPDVVHVQEAYDRLNRQRLPGLLTCFLHDHLSWERKDEVFNPAPAGMRKVVLATDVAETAVLVDGIKYVIDSGIESAQPCKMISKESAWRRTATAGHQLRGICYRLYSVLEHETLEDNPTPQIKMDGALARLVLMLKSHGVDDVTGFSFVDPPTTAALEQAVDELFDDGYLDEHGELTGDGKRAAQQEE